MVKVCRDYVVDDGTFKIQNRNLTNFYQINIIFVKLILFQIGAVYKYLLEDSITFMFRNRLDLAMVG